MTLTYSLVAMRNKVDPSTDEQQELTETAKEIRSKVNNELDNLPVDADVVQTGSTARGTYVTGDRDIDMFICFPETVSEPALERYGLNIGHAVLPDGHEDYASHPYVKGTYNGFDVDLVPCYNVENATNIISAVDRTPFHTRYLEPKISEQLASDVRVAKYFLKQIDIYGSNGVTEGFSGYLTELLVLEAGGFEEFLEMVADWKRIVFVDPADHIDDPREFIDDNGGLFHVIDPVDPNRNVADVVSTRQRMRLQHHARAFLENPGLEYFNTPSPVKEPYDILEEFESRDTAAVAVVFDRPDTKNETLVPQLKRSLSGMTSLLGRHSFEALCSDYFENEESVVLFAEVTPTERAAVEEQRGPPLYLREACEHFLDTYSVDEDRLYITDDGYYALEAETEHRTPTEVLNAKLVEKSAQGAAVEPVLRDAGFSVVRMDIPTTTSNDVAEEFQEGFSSYLNPRP